MWVTSWLSLKPPWGLPSVRGGPYRQPPRYCLESPPTSILWWLLHHHPSNPLSWKVQLISTQGGAWMITSAIVASCRRMHNGSPITVVFVGVMAVVLPTQRDHSADKLTWTGHLVSHLRPFRWWKSFYWSLFYLLSPRIVVLWQSMWETVFLGLGWRYTSFKASLSFLSILVWTFHLILEFGSFCFWY
jgi:hypothetical protein